MVENFGQGSVDDLLNNNGSDIMKGKKLSLKPGIAVTVHFLGFDTPDKSSFVQFKSHYVYDPTLPFANKKKYVKCIGQGCKLCAAGNKASDRYAFMVEHIDNLDESGRIVPKRKILECGVGLAKQLVVKHKQIKPLSTGLIRMLSIQGTTTTYVVDFVDGNIPAQNSVDPNGLTSFNIIKPTPRDGEEAARLSAFVGKTAPTIGQPFQGNSFGGSGQGYQQPYQSFSAPNQSQQNQQNAFIPEQSHSFQVPNNPGTNFVQNQSGFLQDPWANPTPNTVAGNNFLGGGSQEVDSEDDIPF